MRYTTIVDWLWSVVCLLLIGTNQVLINWNLCTNDMEEKWSVDKLDGSNWMTCKFQMCHLLLAKGLWKFVDGAEELSENSSAQIHAKFNKRE